MTRLTLRKVGQGEKNHWAFNWAMLIDLTHHSSPKSICIPKKEKNKNSATKKKVYYLLYEILVRFILTEFHFCALGIYYTAFKKFFV